MKYKILLFSISVLLTLSAKATHIIGGEITYVCLGGNEYEITLKVYRDCFSGAAPFDNPACLGIYDEDGVLIQTFNLYTPVITVLEIVSPDPCLEPPTDICVEEGIYTGSITLPDDDKAYDIAYQRCCRNESILNIEDPDATGATYWLRIPAGDVVECNSSPVFSSFPPIVICLGTDISFDHSAVDPDGDSLVYKFITPFLGGDDLIATQPCPPAEPPYINIDWVTGYDELYQIDASPALAIDSLTGMLTGTPIAEGGVKITGAKVGGSAGEGSGMEKLAPVYGVKNS